MPRRADGPSGKSARKLEPAAAEPAREQEDADAPQLDAVRTYLRQMGGGSLLTREGELALAKRIEEGERRVLGAVLANPLAVDALVDLSLRLARGEVRVRDVLGDVDESDPAFDESQVARHT